MRQPSSNGIIVELIEIDSEEYLFYHSLKPDVCFLRATYADEDWNLSRVHEGVPGSEPEIDKSVDKVLYIFAPKCLQYFIAFCPATQPVFIGKRPER